MNITVYCGSHSGNDDAYTSFARELGAWIADSGHVLVYGGGGTGMMGAVADSALDHKGKVIAVIPQFLKGRESLCTRIRKPILVDTMLERKKILAENADAFVVLPGGIGTMEEASEVISHKYLGLNDKPIFIANVNGYFDDFSKAIRNMCDTGFFAPTDDLYHIVQSVADIDNRLNTLI